MAYLFEPFLPFDGLCSSSIDGDVELRFPDGRSLHAHRSFLSLASPVLNRKLQQQTSAILAMDDSSIDVWRIILNCIYPSNRLQLRSAQADIINDPLTNEVLETISIYKIGRAENVYDMALSSYLQGFADRLKTGVFSMGDSQERAIKEKPFDTSVKYGMQYRLKDTLKAAKHLNQTHYLMSIDKYKTPKKRRTDGSSGASKREEDLTTAPACLVQIQCPCCGEVFEHLGR